MKNKQPKTDWFHLTVMLASLGGAVVFWGYLIFLAIIEMAGGAR